MNSCKIFGSLFKLTPAINFSSKSMFSLSRQIVNGVLSFASFLDRLASADKSTSASSS